MTSPDNRAERMSAYLDAELSAAEMEAFERELEEDPQTQEELEDLKKMLQLVQALPTVEAPDDFYEKVSRKLRRRSLLKSDNVMLMISLPFQVLSIIVILTAAALYMMAELDNAPKAIEKDPDALGIPLEPGQPIPKGPRPVVP